MVNNIITLLDDLSNQNVRPDNGIKIGQISAFIMDGGDQTCDLNGFCGDSHICQVFYGKLNCITFEM